MKNVDDALKESTQPKPRRPLQEHFTANVLEAISSKQNKSAIRERFIHAPFMKMLPTPLIVFVVAFAFIAGFGGVSYALTGGFGFLNAFFEDETTLSDGSRVIAIGTKDCRVIDFKTGDYRPRTQYYKINKDASVSRADVIQLVQAECELANQTSFIDIPKEYDSNTDNPGQLNVQQTTLDTTVTAIDSKTITVEQKDDVFTSRDNGTTAPIFYVNNTRSFGSTSDDVQVYASNGNRISRSDIKIGDKVQLTYLTSSAPSASMKNDDMTSVVIGIQKTSVNIADARGFAAYLNTHFTRVEPCPEATKYCDAKQSAELEGPANYKKYIKLSQALESVTSTINGYLQKKTVTSSYLERHFASSLHKAVTNRLSPTIICQESTPSVMQYGVVGIKKGGTILVSADTHFNANNAGTPAALYEYEVSSEQIVSVRCIPNQDALMRLMSEYNSTLL